VWYLFHGPNALNREEEIAKMKAKLGTPDIAELNITVVERGAPLKELLYACDTLPFLAERRLVIARGVLGGFSKKAAKDKDKDGGKAATDIEQLMAFLPGLSETTRLVFAEDDLLDDKHPLVKLAADKAAGGTVKVFGLPQDPAKWVIERVKTKGAEISPQAAQLLTTRINRGDKNDRDHFVVDSRTYLFKLDTEIDKLSGYANGRRIESADVELLVASEDSADIFAFIDAISLKNASDAYRTVRGVIVRGESPLVVLSHIARQTRVLIMAKEHAHLSNDALAQQIGVHPFVAKKALQQASRFEMHELEHTLFALLEADVAIKTGRMDEGTALDVLIAGLCQ
jgi:DNA polymerase III subunit delta